MYQVDGTVRSVVLDAGSHSVKAGIAGEDLPHDLLPSSLAKKSGADGSTGYDSTILATSPVSRRRDGVTVESPFSSDGLISNWDHFDALLSHTLYTRLEATSGSHALLYAEPNHNGRGARERLVELLFEKHGVPAAYLARAAVLSAYANGRTTGVVLDVGHSGASVVPVIEGAVAKDKLVRTVAGGHALSEALRAQLSLRGVAFRPLWSFKRTVSVSEDDERTQTSFTEIPYPNVTASFYKYAVTAVVEEIKESVCQVFENPSRTPSASQVGNEEYELPDGQTIDLGREKFLAAESVLFGPLRHVQAAPNSDARQSYVNQMLHSGSGGIGGGVGTVSQGLHGLVLDVIRRCDVTLHKDLYAGVCLTGGTTDMPGLFERVSAGLMEKYPRVRVLAATGSHERKYCAWTGGSILGTFSEFQKMWFSKSEYEENGTAFVHRKCP